jgi:hypothetical protein
MTEPLRIVVIAPDLHVADPELKRLVRATPAPATA